jgi:hypothetical protein
MAIVEELLEQIDLDEAECPDPPREWGDGVFQMSFSVAKALLQTAGFAFQMAEIHLKDDSIFCEYCGGDQVNGFHASDCAWQNLLELKVMLGDSDDRI